jgi:hypothetical protein
VLPLRGCNISAQRQQPTGWARPWARPLALLWERTVDRGRTWAGRKFVNDKLKSICKECVVPSTNTALTACRLRKMVTRSVRSGNLTFRYQCAVHVGCMVGCHNPITQLRSPIVHFSENVNSHTGSTSCSRLPGAANTPFWGGEAKPR